MTQKQKTSKESTGLREWEEMVLSFGEDRRKCGVIGNSRYPMMCLMLDNRKDFHDHHC